jgi:tetratricopeptide (TPR) repeat protein
VLGGDREQVRAYNEQSLEVRRRIGDTSRIALSLTNLGWETLADGDIDRAAALFGEAAEIAAGIGDKRHIRASSGGLAWVAYLEQRWEEADSYARESLRLARELGMKPEFVDPTFCLAGIAAATGDTARAARLAAAADLHYSLLGAADAIDSARYEAVIELAKSACDPETWERASAEGRAMIPDEAAEYALSSG